MKKANTVSTKIKRAAAGVILLFLAAGCREEAAPAAAAAAPKTAADYFTIKTGGRPVRMQLAVEQPGRRRPGGDDELSRGLMWRRDLAADQGMIFVYRQPAQMSFWMRNTPTPLDIGFFTADGVLREVRQMYPFDETSVSSARKDIQYALEVNQGWFERNGVKAGATLDLEALAAALKARGFKPENYGLGR